MKFSGELKFPEIDHPGVPVQAVIEESQFELVVEGESLGRWSQYDIEATRLVASAFLLKLEDEEVTFVAADPIDFAYRGVEHMAGTWAHIKTRRPGARSLAIRKSRKGIAPSRIEELRSAMEANLESQRASRGGPLAGERAATSSVADTPARKADDTRDWDDRTTTGAIPVVGQEASSDSEVAEIPSGEVPSAETPTDDLPFRGAHEDLTIEQRRLEEDRRQIAVQRALLEQERIEAEKREAVRIEAYRIEMERLEKERLEAQRLAQIVAAKAAAMEKNAASEEIEPDPDYQPDWDDVDAESEPIFESESVFRSESEPESGPMVEEEATVEPDADSQPEEVAAPAAALAEVVDLHDYEGGDEEHIAPTEPATVSPDPEPALAGAGKDKAGLMGAVRSAFARGGGKTHEHQFVEAPGGLGITRYVCEECGYVSISA